MYRIVVLEERLAQNRSNFRREGGKHIPTVKVAPKVLLPPDQPDPAPHPLNPCGRGRGGGGKT